MYWWGPSHWWSRFTNCLATFTDYRLFWVLTTGKFRDVARSKHQFQLVLFCNREKIRFRKCFINHGRDIWKLQWMAESNKKQLHLNFEHFMHRSPNLLINRYLLSSESVCTGRLSCFEYIHVNTNRIEAINWIVHQDAVPVRGKDHSKIDLCTIRTLGLPPPPLFINIREKVQSNLVPHN